MTNATPVVLVTGASRGLGRGAARALAAAGYVVFATGRTIEAAAEDAVHPIRCDHTDDGQTEAVFARIAAEAGRLDVVLNAAWGGYERMVDGGVWTWNEPFWRQPMHRWSAMVEAGLRATFVCASHAARLMVPARRGLIVNVGAWAAQEYVGNAIYGAVKAATDKMTADMAHELKPHGVATISLYPGLVRTEAVVEAARAGAFDLTNSESPEFTGRVVAALAADPKLLELSGTRIVAAAFARAHGILDIDGKSPAPLTLETA